LFKKYEVHYNYGLGYHPKTIGQVEISNREIKSVLDKRKVRFAKDSVNMLDYTL